MKYIVLLATSFLTSFFIYNDAMSMQVRLRPLHNPITVNRGDITIQKFDLEDRNGYHMVNISENLYITVYFHYGSRQYYAYRVDATTNQEITLDNPVQEYRKIQDEFYGEYRRQNPSQENIRRLRAPQLSRL